MANEVFIVEGIEELSDRLKKISVKSPQFFRQNQTLMREALKHARKSVQDEAKEMLKGKDPRKAYQAVRSSVWKKVLGGQVNILARRRANGRQYVGGNVGSRGASERTRALHGYYGSDRGFVLRFLNAGTDGRVVENMNGRSMRRKSVEERSRRRQYKTGTIGARGSIGARNWFSPAANKSMQMAAEEYAWLLEAAIAKVWNENT